MNYKAIYEAPKLEEHRKYTFITGSCPPTCDGESLPFMPDFMDSLGDFSEGTKE